ncbi:MAG: hypothetical protein K0Q73_5917 [Paenibacillus sp.]|jgi:hypothetical protein|nr:hypothetical protein [Paenibacillus sp.]
MSCKKQLFGLFKSRTRFSPVFPAYLATSVRWNRFNRVFPAYFSTSARWTRFNPVFPAWSAWSRDSGGPIGSCRVENSAQTGRQVERRNEVFAFVFGFQPLNNRIQGQQPKVFEENDIVSKSLEPVCLPYHCLIDIQYQGPDFTARFFLDLCRDG